jgi:RHS repeat-associated protein
VYDEFGREVENTNPGFQPLGYAGGLSDSETRLIRFGARDYDPSAARWVVKDLTTFAGGDPNLYRYALGDPANLLDPDGRRIEYGGFVLCNDLLHQNLARLNDAIARLGNCRDEDFTLRITGGDRFRDPQGRHRSSTTNEVVPNSDRNSPHLRDNGARAVDISVEGVSNELFDAALRLTDFLSANTRRYADGHTHIALPNRPEFYLLEPLLDPLLQFEGPTFGLPYQCYRGPI